MKMNLINAAVMTLLAAMSVPAMADWNGYLCRSNQLNDKTSGNQFCFEVGSSKLLGGALSAQILVGYNFDSRRCKQPNFIFLQDSSPFYSANDLAELQSKIGRIAFERADAYGNLTKLNRNYENQSLFIQAGLDGNGDALVAPAAIRNGQLPAKIEVRYIGAESFTGQCELVGKNTSEID